MPGGGGVQKRILGNEMDQSQLFTNQNNSSRNTSLSVSYLSLEKGNVDIFFLDFEGK